MYARSTTTVMLAAMALAVQPNPAPRFTLGTTGAVTLNAAGTDARYGLIPAEVNGRSMISVTMGAANPQGSLVLSMAGDRPPQTGRYAIADTWAADGVEGHAFHACVVAGSPEQPLGWFHGQSGWVTITEAGPGSMSGEFEIRARGFLGANPDDENQWVTVRGTFRAEGDSTIATIASLD
ncbi:MAG: hypothetical protein ACJ8DC_01795 [Gemmatimonadales bacterium]